MAVELCSENSGMSPRISFSHDLCHFDVVPVEQRPLRSKSSGQNSSIDFDFCVGESLEQEPSSADELFSDGKILPTEIKKKKKNSERADESEPPRALAAGSNISVSDEANMKENPKKERWKMRRDEAGGEEGGGGAADDQVKQSSKSSFWGFKRSSSLNCGSGYGRSLCPLPLLSRSNSTGSTPNVKHNASHPHKHNNSHKQYYAANSSCKSSTSSYQKPPLGKTNYKPYGNGVQVNPVLNVPSANLFGLGSIFFNAKDKTHKKKS